MYRLHLPPQQTEAMPLLMILHGSGGTGTGTISLTHLNDLADHKGILLVYPDGLSKGWADGRGASDSDQRGVDDVAFLSQLISTLQGRFSIDTHRVYLTLRTG
jgi:polyhydroxybutyrate depolymerase